MAKDKTATREVTLTNTAGGPRYVHGVDGPVSIPVGGSVTLTATAGELADLPDGVTEGDAPANPPADQDQPGDASEIPADLALDTSGDGIILRADLDKVAKAEGVEIKADDSKMEVVGKIKAARAARASA